MSISYLEDRNTIMNKVNGAFFCEYDVFENLYEVLLHRCARCKENFFLLLFSLQQSENKQCNDSERLETLLIENLRSNDILTRLNNGQYLALLRYCDSYGAQAAGERTSSILKEMGNTGLKLEYSRCRTIS